MLALYDKELNNSVVLGSFTKYIYYLTEEIKLDGLQEFRLLNFLKIM